MPNGPLSNYTTRGTTTATPWSRLKPKVPQRPDPCEEPCTPRCPVCKGLQCLCRPRFFPGQLLTDEDLNRLERYVIDKNKLHNRYLHGWGVACGLEVVCDPCDPRAVIVRSGYALSPCGDDIIVCGDQSVDICSLIDACEPRDPVCEGPYSAPPRDCRGGVDRWVLAICYDETPVRGVTAQLGAGDTTASARCKCGGSASCGCGGGRSVGRGSSCGCGGSSRSGSSSGKCSCGAASSTPVSGRKTYKPQCEPTQVCEGFRFMAYPAPSGDPQIDLTDTRRGLGSDLIWAWLYANRSRFGPLIERVLCCVTRGMELRASIRQGKAIDRAFAENTYRQYAAALAEFAGDFAVHRCAFVPRVSQLRDAARDWKWDSPTYTNDGQRLEALGTRVTELDAAWLDIVSECLCSALLPACPTPATTNCVPLAVVTLQNDECQVREICNWSERKLLITWPTITYWLSWLPWERLRQWVSAMCCGVERDRDTLRILTLMFGVVFSRAKSQSAASTTIGHMMAGLSVPGTTGAGAAGVAGTPAADSITKAFGADNLLTHMLGGFEQIKTGGAGAALEPAWANVVARLAEPATLAASEPADKNLSAVTTRLERAEKRLLDQEREIARLKKKVR